MSLEQQQGFPAQVDTLRFVNRHLQNASASKEYVLPFLKELHEHDPSSARHSMRVAELLVEAGEQLGLPDEKLLFLGRAGLLHDIGKVDVPQTILQGERRLSPEERAIIEMHPVTAYERLRELDDECAPVVLFHHSLQKDPYPRDRDLSEIVEQNLLLDTTLLAVADQVDALMTPRSYRPFGFTPQEAVSMIAEHDMIDPEIIQPFTEKYSYLYRRTNAQGGKISA